MRIGTLAEMRVRIEYLEEENRQLRTQLVPPTTFPRDWKLAPRQSRILAFLLARHPHPRTTEQIAEAIYPDADRIPDGFSNSIHASISLMRKKLATVGVVVGCVRHEGYFLTEESAKRLAVICSHAVVVKS